MLSKWLLIPLTTVVLILVVEGACSFLFVGLNLARGWNSLTHERFHTQYDEQLGWVNIPNISIPNLYGKGVGLTTNSQGFRNTKNFAVKVPAGKTRVICSGDSFALGFGVSNDQTWCSYLSQINPQLETVNMGQGGYGLDQSYLWYIRDGEKIEHDVHLFTFIEEDFRRMRSPRFNIYGKPYLRMEGDHLKIKGVPVPRYEFLFPRFAQRLQNLRELQLVYAWQTFVSKTTPQEVLDGQELMEVARGIFADLKRRNAVKGRKFRAVFLPSPPNYHEYYEGSLHQTIAQLARAAEIPFVDLTAVIKEMTEDEFAKVILPKESIGFPHYSPYGNELMAQALEKEIAPRSAIPVQELPREL